MTIKKMTLLTSIIICFLPGMIGGLVTAEAIPTWYSGLIKPTLNPPNGIFGPVWTILYFLMGISLYLIRTTKEKDATKKLMANLFFYHQLALNLLWSIFFFGFKNPKLGLAEIGLLDIFVVFTVISFYRINKKAALLMMPYLLWISFATYLNFMIAILNR